MHSISCFRGPLVALLAATWATLTGCGGATPDAASPSAATTSGEAQAAATPPASSVPAVWSKEMTKEQQLAFMKKNVVPTMGPVFQAANATHYADFGCKTCHGPEYKDPHDYLPRLTMKDGKLTAFAEKPEIAKFMAGSVAPKMASAMGLPPFDLKTQQGFGCPGCHAVDVK